MRVEWFAGRLRELREAAGLSRAQLAGKAGLSAGGVRDLEQGVRRPSLDTFIKLCGALGVRCDAFDAEPKPRAPSKGGRPRGARGAAQGG